MTTRPTDGKRYAPPGTWPWPNYSSGQEVLRRVRRTFHAFARVKRGERPGFPGYKSAPRFNRITLSSYGAGIELSSAVLRVQGVGGLKVKLSGPAQGRSQTVAV